MIDYEPSLLTEPWLEVISREYERKPSLNFVRPDDRRRDEGREDESESKARLSKDSKGPVGSNKET